jgi:hypothetical protein
MSEPEIGTPGALFGCQVVVVGEAPDPVPASGGSPRLVPYPRINRRLGCNR